MSSAYNSTETGYGMARVLVQYIPDPQRVRSEILSNLEFAPDLDTITMLRAEWLKRGRKIVTKGTAEPLPPKDTDEDMRQASEALLRALYRSHPYVFEAARRHNRAVTFPASNRRDAR